MIIKQVSPRLLNESIQVRIKSDKVIINSVSKKMNYLGVKNYLSKEANVIKDSLEKMNEQLRSGKRKN